MPTKIYNEGRVVGLSAYEIYLRHHLMEDITTPPATETQWLASSISMGTSMILKVPEVEQGPDDHTFIDIRFPDNCMLSAANTIVASFFDGDATFDGQWATRVTDYGQLISNTESSSPKDVVSEEFSSSDVPTQTLQDLSNSKKLKLEDYMKIVDGIVIQPGKWEGSSGRVPYKDFSPREGSGSSEKMSGRPTIRLHIKGNLVNEPYVLLTGFSIRYVLSGVTSMDGSLDTPRSEDGDFLGPSIFPWCNKIVFSVPSSFIEYFYTHNYGRKLPQSSSEISIEDEPVIDMRSKNPHDYYSSNYTTAPVSITVTKNKSSNGYSSILTVYQKKDIYPPALYASLVSSTGSNYINPIDIVAPGSVKIFDNATADTLKGYEETFPGTFALSRLSSGSLQTLDSSDNLVYVRRDDISVSDINHAVQVSTSKKAKALVEHTDTQTSVSLSLSSSVGDTSEPTQYTFSRTPSSTMVPEKNITWSMLLEALANDKDIDILEDRLKLFKSTLPDIKSGESGTLYVDKNYIVFGNGLRLYISSSVPTDSDVPEGSIGIGWGFNTVL